MPDYTAKVNSNPSFPAVSQIEDIQKKALVPFSAELPPLVNSSTMSASETICTLQGSESMINSSTINSLNNVVIVTSASGQMFLVSTIVSAVNSDQIHTQLSSVPSKATEKKSIGKKVPVTIAPKPVFTPESNTQVPATYASAVSEALSGSVEEFKVPDNVNDPKGTSQPNVSKLSEPLMKTKQRLLSKRPRQIRQTNNGKIVEVLTNPKSSIPKPHPVETNSQITSAMAQLLSIATEACKAMNISDEKSVAEASKSSDVASSLPFSSQCDGTRKGDAKRTRKHSPAPRAEALDGITSNKVTYVANSLTAACVPTSGPISLGKTNFVQETSILNEMENTRMKETNVNKEAMEPQPNLLGFGTETFNQDKPLILPSPSGSAIGIITTRLTQCVGEQNNFDTWDGKIPRTPEIRFDPNTLTSSSPFQISSRKEGFRFFPLVESSSLPAPATPSIDGSNNSSETNRLCQFPRVFL